jgi:predicted DNA-binding transcriptional regulator YafY
VFHTARETVQATLTRLIKAMDAETPVTITYTKADDTETVRTIEIYDILVTLAGDIVVKAMDRESGESRTWRLDRIRTYTLHRSMTYTVVREEKDEKPQALPSLRRPHLVLITNNEDDIPAGTDPVEILADALAA